MPQPEILLLLAADAFLALGIGGILWRLKQMSDTSKTTTAEIKAELLALNGKLDAANQRVALHEAAQDAAVAKLQALVDGPKDTSEIDADLADILAGLKAAGEKADAIDAANPAGPVI